MNTTIKSGQTVDLYGADGASNLPIKGAHAVGRGDGYRAHGTGKVCKDGSVAVAGAAGRLTLDELASRGVEVIAR